MPFIAAFLAIFASRSFLMPLIVHILTILGFGLVSYAGVAGVLALGESYVRSMGSGLPQFAVWFLVNTGLTVGGNLVFSALGASLAYRGLTAAGTINKLVFRGQLNLPFGIPGT